jgi:cobalamin-dependent methionine synthase I
LHILVEKCCNIVEQDLRNLVGRDKSSRFSPGYGDFNISFQKQLLDILYADRIGIYYNEANMMFPQKTVTAIVKFAKFNSGCKVCSKEDCNFKKY